MERCRTTRSRSMVTALILMALLGPAATFALTAESENDEMPLKIAQDPNALAGIQPDLVPKTGWPPLWIDARAIELTPEGKLDLEKPTPLGPPTTWRQLFASYQPGRWGPRGWEAQETRGCHPIGTIWVDEVFPPSHSSLARTIETVETVVFGRVVGKSYGFYRGIPGQLIKIAPLKTFGLSPRSKGVMRSSPCRSASSRSGTSASVRVICATRLRRGSATKSSFLCGRLPGRTTTSSTFTMPVRSCRSARMGPRACPERTRDTGARPRSPPDYARKSSSWTRSRRGLTVERGRTARQIQPRRNASATASTWLWTSSFRRTFWMWFRTVAWERFSFAAMLSAA